MFAATAKILIVDDMKTMRKLLTRHLNTLGFSNLTEAEDGDKALSLIQDAFKANQPFELVISDWNMPKMKGISLLRKLRSDARTKNLPFIMCTAEVEAGSLKEASAPDANASGFVSKPFRPDELKTQLAQAFAAHAEKAA